MFSSHRPAMPAIVIEFFKECIAMQIADVEAIRTVRHEIARHAVDSSLVTISAHYGIVHLNGEVRPLTGHELEFGEEIHSLYRCLKNRRGIRDVVFDWKLPSGFAEATVKRAR